MASSKDTFMATKILAEDMLLRNLSSGYPGIENNYKEKVIDSPYSYTNAVEMSPVVESQQAEAQSKKLLTIFSYASSHKHTYLVDKFVFI